MAIKRIRVVCDKCDGRCVYHGFMQLPGEAVPCSGCDGKGYQLREPFKDIAPMQGINHVVIRGSELVPYEKYITEQKRKNKKAD